MPAPLLLTGLAALVFAAIHIAGPSMAFLRTTPRSIWLSLAGGVSVAYVFVHVLPELARFQSRFKSEIESASLLSRFESHIYLIALIGLCTFYGLHRAVRRAGSPLKQEGGTSASSLRVFWVHLASYAFYSVLIGYLLLHREEQDLRGLALYSVAMGFHFIVNDQGLREDHGAAYDKRGRWILAAAPLIGWGMGAMATLHPLLISSLFGFLMGGVVLNVLKEELPDNRESRFWAFALGAIFYAVVLLGTR
jgi:hypothetical protein